mgnify:CR=1 FL=1
MKNSISVVIPTYAPDLNNISNTIQSVWDCSEQSNLDVEIIVVDNGPNPTKDLKSAVETLGCLYKYTDVVGANHARNLGASMSAGDILYFTDDDCILLEGCLDNILKVHQYGEFLVGGKVVLKYESAVPDWMCHSFESMLAKLDLTNDNLIGGTILDITDDPAKYIVSANMSIKRVVFNMMDGFDERHGYFGKTELAPNDELTLINNCRNSNMIRVVYTNSSVVEHIIPEERTTEEYFYKRYYGQGLADSRTTESSYKQMFPDSDLETVLTNTVLKKTLLSNWLPDIFQNSLEKKKFASKEAKRNFIRIFVNCTNQYIQAVKDYMEKSDG